MFCKQGNRWRGPRLDARRGAYVRVGNMRDAKSNARRLRRAAAWTAACAVAAAVLWHWAVPFILPFPEGLREPVREHTVVLDREGKEVLELVGERGCRHRRVRLEEVPEAFVACTLAAEDRRFFAHGGVDYAAVIRAALANAASGRVVSGASTITQQLVKLSGCSRGRSLWAKAGRMLWARRVEMEWDKWRILEEYFNRACYAGSAIGADSGARLVFGKPLAQLSPGECALLAALPQAPGKLDPRKANAKAEARRARVLALAAEKGLMEPAVAAAAMAERVEPAKRRGASGTPGIPPAAFHAAVHATRGAAGAVRTTLELRVQRIAERALESRLMRLREARVGNAAAVVLEHASGNVVALVGSGARWPVEGVWMDATRVRRSAGSTLKPFTVGVAFEAGAYPGSVVPDTPARYPASGGFFVPENYDRRYRGPVTLRAALGNSLNAACVATLARYGGAEALARALGRAGITDLREAGWYGLGLTIGNAEVPLLELVGAYGALARGGEWIEPGLVVGERQTRVVFAAETAFLVLDILSDNAARSSGFGAESALRFPFKVAAKTGTSSDFRDNWCLAITARYVVGVWMGNMGGQPMRGVSGVTGAAEAVREIVLAVEDPGLVPAWAQPPEGLVKAAVDIRTGKLVAPRAMPAPEHVTWEWVLAGALPPVAQASDYDAAGNALLAEAEYGEWLRGTDHAGTSGLAAEGTVRCVPVPPQSVSPVAESTYVLDPELPGGGVRLPLRANLEEGRAEWRSETLRIEPAAGGMVAVLVPGEHVLELTDRATGASAAVPIRVIRR